MDDLIERLRALSRHEHSDYSIGEEAADALEAAREYAGLWRQAFVNERARLNLEHGMSLEHARIHAETDAEIAAIDQARGKGVANA